MECLPAHRFEYHSCDAIVEKFPIEFPTDLPSLRKLANEFALRQRWYMRVFKGIIGAIDGILIKIKCPSIKEVGMPKHY